MVRNPCRENACYIDRAAHASLPPEGWCVPAAPGVLRPVRLRTDVGLSGGAYTLTLAGTPGAFRIWPDATGTNAPLLECGQTVTNGAGGASFLAGPDTGLHVEAVSNGVAKLTYAFAGDGEAWGLTCSATLKMTAFNARVLLDTNRDGQVDECDEAGKNAAVTFEGPEGAVIIANTDDDAAGQTAQPDCSDNVINGEADLPDVYALKIRKLGIPADLIPDGLVYTLKVENPPDEGEGAPPANARVRIFRSRTGDADGVIGPDLTDAVVFRKEPGEGEMDIALLAGTGCLEMGMEGIAFGREVLVRLVPGLNGQALGADTARLLVSPFLALSNLAPATKVYIGADNSEYSWPSFYNSVSDVLNGVVPLESCATDVFVQDYAEFGYTRSALGQPARHQSVIMALELGQFEDMVDTSTGYFRKLIGNQGGNIEVSPPIPSFAFGRLIVGNNLPQTVKTFLIDQKLQANNGELIELPATWLEVGHVDELFTIIPAGSGFAVLVADLQSAIDEIRTNQNFEVQHDNLPSRETLLSDYESPAYSYRVAAINATLASIRATLAQQLGITEESIIRVPVAFTIKTYKAMTYLPNMINLLAVVNSNGQRRLAIPYPYYQPFEFNIAAKLSSIGYQNGEADFVDTYGPHAAKGEVHCATNSKRIPQ